PLSASATLSVPTTAKGCSASLAHSRSSSRSSGRRRRSSPESRTSCDTRGSPHSDQAPPPRGSRDRRASQRRCSPPRVCPLPRPSPTRGRRASSRQTASRPARASSSARRRKSSMPGWRPPPRSAARWWSRSGSKAWSFRSSLSRTEAGHCRSPPLDERDVGELVDQIHRPVLAELAARRTPFLGLLYAGLMLTEDGPRVLEFNCRFGDPETQAILPRLDGDLLAALAAAAGGDLRGVTVGSTGGAAVTVVLAAGSYPDHPDVGSRIDGVPDAEELGALVFHAGTAQRDGELMTSGGRILNVTGVGSDLEAARARAYEAAAAIAFDGVRYRRDVALEEARVLG